jgi:ATP-binding cassette subfamily A (ABC1) protein 3
MANEKQDAELAKIDDFDMANMRIKDQGVLFFTHTAVLLQKRMRYFKRDLRSLCCEIFLPCLVVVCGLGLMSISFVVNAPALEIKADNFDWDTTKSYWAGVPQTSQLIKYFDQPPWEVK